MSLIKKATKFEELLGVCAEDFCIERAVEDTNHCEQCTMMLGKREKMHAAEADDVAVYAETDQRRNRNGIYASRETGNHSVDRIEAIQAGGRKKADRRRAREVANDTASGDAPVGSTIETMMGIDHPLVTREQMAHVIDEALDLDVASPESRSSGFDFE